ncbi:hypothetical protein GCM10010277_12340 [Streptomyces longisporoflavus]|uniref:hypothetical protein n=1 Tax=Streptomyces longisporoflavus TaxID=28044 RepID=UPI0019C2B397|nr:hypothetical protein [Streptomyces longisporoflavus]GGV29500.1 hypothetical protein GCM10010277_12340 [Streptomyces longisporoflavus]
MIENPALPTVGTLVVDGRTDKAGIVMGHEGPYVQLRPPRGGVEWDAPPEVIREPTQAEGLSAKVFLANEVSRGNGRWGM